jgi:hypothetical protein
MLSFQVVGEGNAIQIHCDQEGMEILNAALADVVGKAPGHIHLRGRSAGGSALSETSPFGDPAAAEVIIDYNP